eukprot:407244-Amphidinium_carterae.1
MSETFPALGCESRHQCCVVAICAAPVQSWTLRLASKKDAVRGQRTKVRLKLPAKEWLLQKLRNAGFNDAADSIKAEEGSSHLSSLGRSSFSCHMLGVAKLHPGSCYDKNCFPTWSDECQLLHDFFLQPHDAYSLRVLETAELKEPQRIFTYVRKTCPKDGVRQEFFQSSVSVHKPLFCPTLPSHATRWLMNSETGTLLDVLTRWGCRNPFVGDMSDSEPLIAICLPSPIAGLVVKGRWPELPVLKQWHGRQTGCPD